MIVGKSLGSQYRGNVSDANKLIGQRKYDEAVNLLDYVIEEFETKILKKDRSHVSVFSRDEYKAYIKTKGDSKIAWIDWSYSQAYFFKAFIASELHQFEKALRLLDTVIELSPYNSIAYSEKGNILNALKRPDEALLAYRAAFEFSERFSSQLFAKAAALRGMGFSYIELGELSNAKQMYENSLAIDDKGDIATRELEYIKHLMMKSHEK